MEAPLSIKQDTINGRAVTVVRLANGLIKLIYEDGECTFLAPVKKDAPTPASEKTDA